MVNGFPRAFFAKSLALIALSAAACSKPKETKEQPVQETVHGLTEEQSKMPLVVVGDTTVTVGEFAQRLADKSPYLRARYASPERRRELLDELVKFELLAAEAERRGLDQAEEVKRAKRQVMIQQMMKAEFEDKVKLSDITDQDISDYYNAHPEEFHKPAQVRASVVVVRDEAKAKRVLKLAQEARDEDAFRKLVAEFSEDPATKTRGGDLSFFSKPDERGAAEATVADAVAEAAFTLKKVGDVYPEPVRTPSGFTIVRLTGTRRALARSLEHAQRMIQNKLWREKREAAVNAFMQRLREKAHVEEHLDKLNLVQVEVPSAETPEKGPKPRRPGGAHP